MKFIFNKTLVKLITFSGLALTVFGFCYFESSWLLRVLVIFFALLAIWQAENMPDLLANLTLYFGLYLLYNIRYGLAVPLAIIMVAVFLLTVLLNHYQALVSDLVAIQERSVYWLNQVGMGLVILEIFLAMSVWPVDPKTKSVVIVVIFYLFSKIIYLGANNMLSLKRAGGFVLVSLLVLVAVVALSMTLGY